MNVIFEFNDEEVASCEPFQLNAKNVKLNLNEHGEFHTVYHLEIVIEREYMKGVEDWHDRLFSSDREDGLSRIVVLTEDGNNYRFSGLNHRSMSSTKDFVTVVYQS